MIKWINGISESEIKKWKWTKNECERISAGAWKIEDQVIFFSLVSNEFIKSESKIKKSESERSFAVAWSVPLDKLARLTVI